MWWKICCFFVVYTLQKNTFASSLTSLNPCCNVTSPKSIRVSKNDVIFTLYNSEYSNGKIITGNDASIDNNEQIITLTQGFLENSTTFPWVITMKDNYRALYPNSSVIIVDWFKISQNIDYFYVTCQVPGVANLLAKLIKAFTDNGKNPKLVHLIGFSLGAQISGLAGQRYFKMTRKKVKIITGLDAAGPCYTFPTIVNKNQRISTGDADYVEVVHTNDYELGTGFPVGNTDFFFSFGTIQPTCLAPPLNVTSNLELSFIYYTACSHEKATFYWNQVLTGTILKACNSTSSICLFPIILRDTNFEYNGNYYINV